MVWLNGLVVTALVIRARGPQFTQIASAVSQLQETGIQKGVFGA